MNKDLDSALEEILSDCFYLTIDGYKIDQTTAIQKLLHLIDQERVEARLDELTKLYGFSDNGLLFPSEYLKVRLGELHTLKQSEGSAR